MNTLFSDAATNSNARIVINYASEVTYITDIINTKSSKKRGAHND